MKAKYRRYLVIILLITILNSGMIGARCLADEDDNILFIGKDSIAQLIAGKVSKQKLKMYAEYEEVEIYYAIDIPPLATVDEIEVCYPLLILDNLNFLCYFKNIKSLTISGRFSITDFSYIGELINLEYLVADNLNIQDIDFIAKLINLELLSLNGNQISDLTPLQNLNQLINLSLSDNYISDITPLGKMESLEWLKIDGNKQLVSLKPLENSHKIESLSICNTGIDNLKEVGTLTSLFELSASGNNITSVDPLSSLTNLIYLDLRENQITDIEPIQRIVDKATVHLFGNPCWEKYGLKYP